MRPGIRPGASERRRRDAFERDRARDARLVAAGHRVMRFTWRQLQADAAWERLTAALRRR